MFSCTKQSKVFPPTLQVILYDYLIIFAILRDLFLFVA